MIKTAFCIILVTLLLPVAISAQEYDDRRIVPGISTAKNTEFAPTISADGKLMIFESDVDKDKGWELFESHVDDRGNWSAPVPLKSINEKCSFVAGPNLSYDGNTLYFTAFIEDVSTSEDIYYSERLEGNNWSEPISVGQPVNTKDSYEGFPSISADGNSLYFIRSNEKNLVDARSKEDCFVIFVSHREPDGSWGPPEALPAPINTGCERDPKIMADNVTLIFASIRDGRKGKYDLFESRRQPDNSWSEPVPLDFVNSGESDQSPCIPAAGGMMYYNRLKDIYTVTMPDKYRQLVNVIVRGKIKSDKGKPVKATIHVSESNSLTTSDNTSNATDGAYLLVLAAGKKYTLEYSLEGYVTEKFEIDFENQKRYIESFHDVTLHSTYILNLTIDENGQNSLLNAFFTATTPGEEEIRDTIKISQYPFRVTLKANKDYELKASADKFPETKVDWKFDPQVIRGEMSLAIHLVPEKVKFVVEVTNIVSRQKSKVKVYFNNEDADEVIIADAGDVVLLRKGDRYQVMTGSDKGLFFSSTSVIAGEGIPNPQGHFSVEMSVVPIEVGGLLTLNHITFPSNSSSLNSSSLLELNRVIEVMQKNPGLQIEIDAHTDNKGSEFYNQKLSQNRAASVVDYLIKQGVPLDRMKPVGFGEKRPKVPNTSEKNRAINRRVELHVLKYE